MTCSGLIYFNPSFGFINISTRCMSGISSVLVYVSIAQSRKALLQPARKEASLAMTAHVSIPWSDTHQYYHIRAIDASVCERLCMAMTQHHPLAKRIRLYCKPAIQPHV